MLHTNKRYTMLQSSVPIGRPQMHDICPAIFATEPWDGCSDKYRFISTTEVLDALLKEGFHVYMVGQSTPRAQDKHDYAKHMLRLRRGTDQTMINGVADEIVLVNSMDKSSSAIMFAGVFRCVCMNGQIVGNISQEVRIPHRGNKIGDYIEGAYTIVDQFGEITKHREGMQQLQLTYNQAEEFAAQASEIRWPKEDQETIQSSYLLSPRRREDVAHDLWTVFNVVQENLIRGGSRGYTVKGNYKTIRKVTGIDQLTNINRKLWDLADQYLEAA